MRIKAAEWLPISGFVLLATGSVQTWRMGCQSWNSPGFVDLPHFL